MISVCLATYNGSKTLERQLRSILSQLTASDEVIVVDDHSSDNTVKLCRNIFNEYPVGYDILINEKNRGPIYSFEKAIEQANGDFIYLCDQDDEWLPNKVQAVQQAFKEQQADLVIHDAHVVDGNFREVAASWNQFKKNQPPISVLRNFYKNGLAGCMMAFTKRLKKLILPFPTTIQMHDQWIFLVAKKNNYPVVHLAQPLMNYVRHGGNVTGMKKRSKKEMLIGRWTMLKCYLSMRKTKN